MWAACTNTCILGVVQWSKRLSGSKPVQGSTINASPGRIGSERITGHTQKQDLYTCHLYSCGQIALDPCNFGSRQKVYFCMKPQLLSGIICHLSAVSAGYLLFPVISKLV